MTLENILEYTEAKGIKVEIQGTCSSLKYRHDNINDLYPTWTSSDFRIGFEFQRNVYYWFYSFDEDVKLSTSLSFDHRYNCGNGAVQKSFHKGYECQRKVKQFLNK